MSIPNIFKQDNYAVKYNVNDGSEIVYYVPEEYFNTNTKNPVAQIEGEFVSMFGLCAWTIVDKNGKIGNIKLLKIPTMFYCKPYKIDKVKDFLLPGSVDKGDYRVLRFGYGDEVISNIYVEKNVDNAEMLFKILVFTAKVPNIIDADKLWLLFLENAKLNGFKYGLNIQLYGMLTSILTRDKNDVSKLFRHTSMKNMNDYKLLSIRLVPKYISPFTAITSENFDDGIRASVLLSDTPEEDIPYSPLEKVVMQ